MSKSPQFGQFGLFTRPMVNKCLLRGQWPVSAPEILLIFFLLSDRIYLEFLALILMQFLECLAWFVEVQCLLKALRFHWTM